MRKSVFNSKRQVLTNGNPENVTEQLARWMLSKIKLDFNLVYRRVLYHLSADSI